MEGFAGWRSSFAEGAGSNQSRLVLLLEMESVAYVHRVSFRAGTPCEFDQIAVDSSYLLELSDSNVKKVIGA